MAETWFRAPEIPGVLGVYRSEAWHAKLRGSVRWFSNAVTALVLFANSICNRGFTLAWWRRRRNGYRRMPEIAPTSCLIL